jgi:hypothetical protein
MNFKPIEKRSNGVWSARRELSIAEKFEEAQVTGGV